jgi:Fe-S-cluster-containing dehydrogenase component
MTTTIGGFPYGGDEQIFVMDQSRCIGCRACVQACEECGTHRGHSMIHLDDVDRLDTAQTVPMVCMHCTDPTCAEVCPADAIKQNEEGVVQSALKPRCIGCSNCVVACPFGVPKMISEFDLMMKCDLCVDRTSVGSKPMCASVCPSDALWYGTPEHFAATRRGPYVDSFVFGNQPVTTRVKVVVDEPDPVDVLGSARAARPWQDDPFALEEAGA